MADDQKMNNRIKKGIYVLIFRLIWVDSVDYYKIDLKFINFLKSRLKGLLNWEIL